ncbi:hypothetical protein CASFOL_000128 [Castilleja foliolosa]|uniref:Uncharacterized protein n=1 Tax=Castilleja foliolosa TaxID=1961234 RepID=A0ABD3EPV5_9LAMI
MTQISTKNGKRCGWCGVSWLLLCSDQCGASSLLRFDFRSTSSGRDLTIPQDSGRIRVNSEAVSWSAIRLLSASAGGSRFSSYVKCGVTVLMATRSDWLMWAVTGCLLKDAVELRQAKMAWIWAEQLSKLRRERSCWNGEAAAEAKSWVLSGFSAGSVQPLIAFHQPREFNFLRIGLYNFSILNVYSICRSPPRKMYPQIELVGLHLD